MSQSTFDVRFWKIDVRRDRRTPYRVRWVVADRTFSELFMSSALAESFKAQLITAARKGEGFDTESGLPLPLLRELQNVSFFDHAQEFASTAWKAAAAKSRIS